MISSAAFFSSTLPISTNSSTARSARSSRVRTPLRARVLARGSPAISISSGFGSAPSLDSSLAIAGARAQLLDYFLVEFLDPVQFAGGHIGDLLDRGKALLHQNARDVGVDIE